ncbi:SDR family oxidoreductase [Skermanella pratensis]|uniref:SDR family oxidoreductase n=1 Tax=Skermanella pratensis TaxID=2233999 RepID=UPI0013011BDC|nr:SDR family oxidoreductase [Skermanella pratensis]
MTRLAGKVALVTGGSRGIGASIARRLAAEGADVALTYARSPDKARETVAAIETLGRRALAVEADNADAAAVTAAVEATVEAFGRIDILVNNAGIARMGHVDELTLQDFDDTMAVNVRAAFVASKAAAARMVDGGRIVSIGSCLADRVPGPGFSVYSMSKAALVGMTKGLARDLGPRGITVNVVHPGPTDTDMNPASGPMADGQRSMMAVPRFGNPDDLAAMVAWLAGPEARGITGAGFAVDGGTNA